ncbi:agmatine deiminase [Gemmatimonas phototrophica]|uniref:Agmatine deiminase n=2 Tax=Gemmatimonas phototrophica TaxID=1379270 RepID=A0A145Q4H8_9BACT|nr:agmatine deiminase [Gemmatimonas phototrophica]
MTAGMRTPDDTNQPSLRMPAEWERHDATWIGWPHHEPDWPGKFGPIPWVYAEIVRGLGMFERVEILCHNEQVAEEARDCLALHGVEDAQYRLHLQPTDRVWLRDSGATGVHRADGSVALVRWGFNAWAKYDNFALDNEVPARMADISGLPIINAVRHDNGQPLILEGGGIETDGRGTLLVTEEWLLSDVQVRNPGYTREDYERAFAEYLGIGKTIWLGEGCVGDDTHGHIDDIARFIAPGMVLLAHEEDERDENHRRSLDNLRRLQRATDARGERIEVVTLPYPRAVIMDGMRLPASYANFYIGNGVCLVPTFNDRNDRVALNTLAELLPEHHVIGIHAVDLVWGLGTLHCLSQQQPAPLGAL